MNFSQMKSAVKTCLDIDLVPMVEGAPGQGKSSMMKEIAKEANLKLIDVRLAQCDPTDLLGFPSVDKEANKASYTPMDTFPLETDALPKGMNGWLLFLDELPNASTAVQIAAYKLILDREVGNHKLHPNCYIVAAGNREQDGCFVQEFPEALKSRVTFLDLETTYEEFLDYASKNNFSAEVIGFINFKPSALNMKIPDSEDKAYACNRTWEFADRIIQSNSDAVLTRNLLNGTIGTVATSEFTAFCKYYNHLPNYKDVINNKAKPVDSSDVGIMYALTSMLSANYDDKQPEANVKACLDYLDGYPKEYILVYLKGILAKNKKLAVSDALDEHLIEIGRIMHS